tara:strand:- start:1568 stop:1708 length:141 start_codon:yes stop_codon:yes gene_type:complete
MHGKSVTRIGRNPWQETKSGSRLIAFLKKWIKKREAKIPKYLTGKN